MVVASASVFGYQELLELVRLAEDVKSAKANIEQVQNIEQYKSVESFAELNLWYLEQTQPRIFMRIETADNATATGYFRVKYRSVGNVGKLGLLKEYFKIKQ